MKPIRFRLGLSIVLVLGLVVTGCTDAFGIGGRGLEGRYRLDGTVDGAPFYHIDGEIRVRDYRRDEARVDIDWIMRDERGGTIYSVRSQSSARAYVRGDYISFEFEGWLNDGRYGDVRFVLEHEGEVRGRTMIGYWDIWVDRYGRESGTFRGVR